MEHSASNANQWVSESAGAGHKAPLEGSNKLLRLLVLGKYWPFTLASKLTSVSPMNQIRDWTEGL